MCPGKKELLRGGAETGRCSGGQCMSQRARTGWQRKSLIFPSRSVRLRRKKGGEKEKGKKHIPVGKGERRKKDDSKREMQRTVSIIRM